MRQRGFLSAELSQYLIVALLLFTLFVPPLFQWARLYQNAASINQTIETITQAAQFHYAKTVLTTRCLPQTALSLADLDLPLTHDDVRYEVRYLQSGAPKARPSGIQVGVTIIEPKLHNVATRLTPDEIQGATLLFNAPLNYQLPDWQQLDISTGCIR
ncbi:transporter [Vibrio sinensis]|uniref:Transporter n=1 Tax=Vibrio sinensis TaxID=2302434 RepID=A0A3A6QW38_9VIBR|nr:transporter [Vibrio sinensis]RJX65864.1 transporter [Vibrio sinensis]